jgi:hypothetical protein
MSENYEKLVYRQYTMEEFLRFMTNCLLLHAYSFKHVVDIVQEFLNGIENNLDIDFLLFPYIHEYPFAIRFIKHINMYGFLPSNWKISERY